MGSQLTPPERGQVAGRVARTLALDKLVGLTAGADDYVIKPYDPVELVARVRTALERVRQMRDLNPLTGFPGNLAIGRRYSAGRPVASLQGCPWWHRLWVRAPTTRSASAARSARAERMCTGVTIDPEASPSQVYGAGLLIPLGRKSLARSNRAASAAGCGRLRGESAPGRPCALSSVD